MRVSGEKGFGLILMIMLIALSAIMIGGVTAYMTNAAALGALRVNQARTYYLAHSAIIRSFADWDDSFDTDDNLGNYAPSTTNTGNEYINTNFQSNFAAFSTDSPNFNAEWWPEANPSLPATPAFPPAPNLWCTTDQNAAQSRLSGWTIQNIRTNDAATTNDNIVVTGIKVWWTGGAGLTISRVRLALNTASLTTGGTAVFAGAGANGALLNITGVAAASRTLTPGQRWTGPCTYIQWSGRMPSSTRVLIQLTFSDNSTSHEVVLWDGLANGTGRPHIRTFSITGTGEVRMTKFGALKKLRATFSYEPKWYDHFVRVLGWENLDR